MVTSAIEKAQRKVEGRNFDIPKNLLEYDDVANDQRKVVYAECDSLLATDDVSQTIADLRAEVVNTIPVCSARKSGRAVGCKRIGACREGQAVRWVAPNMLDQFEFPEANHRIIEALNIQKMYSGNIVIHPTFNRQTLAVLSTEVVTR